MSATANARITRPELAAPAPRGQGETVLVVEDLEALSATVCLQLDGLGYATLAAASADAALELLRGAARIDLLFTDIVMPGAMDGRHLALAARQLRPGLRCLLTTGYDRAHSAAKAATSHLPVLAKPYRRDDLARAVREALDAEAA